MKRILWTLTQALLGAAMLAGLLAAMLAYFDILIA
jgi:hypothetical protein